MLTFLFFTFTEKLSATNKVGFMTLQGSLLLHRNRRWIPYSFTASFRNFGSLLCGLYSNERVFGWIETC